MKKIIMILGLLPTTISFAMAQNAGKYIGKQVYERQLHASLPEVLKFVSTSFHR